MTGDKNNQKFKDIAFAQKILTDAVLFALERTDVPSVNSALASLCATFLANMTDPHLSKAIFLTGLEGLFGLFTGAHQDLSPEEIDAMLNKQLDNLLKQMKNQSKK